MNVCHIFCNPLVICVDAKRVCVIATWVAVDAAHERHVAYKVDRKLVHADDVGVQCRAQIGQPTNVSHRELSIHKDGMRAQVFGCVCVTDDERFNLGNVVAEVSESESDVKPIGNQKMS